MTQTKDGRTVEWADARRIADRLSKLCRDVGFAPPEFHGEKLTEAAALVTEIAIALCLVKPVDGVAVPETR